MACAASGRAAGLTLLELMIVMGLLAMIVGVGAGMFAGLNPGERTAVGLVQNLLRTAHNSAVARSAPARVRIDRETGALTAEGMEVIGTWHFESADMRGANEMDGVALSVSDTAITPRGYQGSAVSFAGEPPGARVEFPIQTDPAYDFELGFAIELAVRLESYGAAPMIDVGGAVSVEAARLGALEASFFALTVDRLGQLARGARVSVETPPGVLRTGRWVRLRVVYDRRALRVFADGVEVAAVWESSSVWRVEGPLVLSGGRSPFPGAIDNLVVSAVTGEQRAALPAGVVFTADTPTEIVYAPGGALDPSLHREPARVGLAFESGRRELIQVNLYGTVE